MSVEKADKNTVYRVTFVDEDGTVIDTLDSVPYNTAVTTVPDVNKEGYLFLGWYKDGVEFDFNEKITENTVLVAKYEKTPAVTFSPESLTMTVNTEASISYQASEGAEVIDIALKDKYNRDVQSARMLDIIRDSLIFE